VGGPILDHNSSSQLELTLL